jgi:hypothetical protein
MEFRREEFSSEGYPSLPLAHRLVFNTYFDASFPSYRWINESRSIYLYIIRRGGGPGWFGGDFILSINEMPVEFRASWTASPVDYICSVSMIKIPVELGVARELVESVIIDSLSAYFHGDAWMPIQEIKISFKAGI